jgi:hypothetical protein
MKIFLLSLFIFSLLFYTDAYADCSAMPDKSIEVKIDKISSPVFDGSGNEVKGCLLHAEGQVIGYTQEDNLCHSTLGSSYKVRLSYGCCDTGPDFGDLECIVRSKLLLGISPAHGNGVVVHSVKHQ